jgi:hypothetical protein
MPAVSALVEGMYYLAITSVFFYRPDIGLSFHLLDRLKHHPSPSLPPLPGTTSRVQAAQPASSKRFQLHLTYAQQVMGHLHPKQLSNALVATCGFVKGSELQENLTIVMQFLTQPRRTQSSTFKSRTTYIFFFIHSVPISEEGNQYTIQFFYQIIHR